MKSSRRLVLLPIQLASTGAVTNLFQEEFLERFAVDKALKNRALEAGIAEIKHPNWQRYRLPCEQKQLFHQLSVSSDTAVPIAVFIIKLLKHCLVRPLNKLMTKSGDTAR
mmetsp:Transcript_36467/g.75888  ORF Transcript_36467/g.75888 Transcript_36467/m.75888 type:complete len:110 (+) Transcript_36467:72-401(+)